MILSTVHTMDWEVQSSLPRVLYLTGIYKEREGQSFEKEHAFLLEMKTYALSSPHYAWTVLEGIEKYKRDRNRQNIKSQKKTTFLEGLLYNPSNDIIFTETIS